ncbi:ATP-binding cassette sub-family C member 5-like [Argopecten irradians]|uniref:ATP-binding cassette sub-family C member 5-like n=1 Tax=Argopecten irradians TaxID=31199 RepID=UPI00371C125B
MDAGELVQHGTHEALMTTKGHYQSLMKQFSSNKDTKGVMDGKSIDREFAVNCIPTSQDSTSSYADKYTKGVLTDRETSKVGDISFAAYMSYIRASGGTIVCSCVLLLYICALSAVAFTEWWFGLWIKRMNAPVLDSFPSNDTTVAIKNIAFPGQSYNVTTSPRMLKEEEETNWYLSIYIYSTLGILGLAVLKGVVAGSVLTKAAVTLHSNVVGRIMGVPMQFFDANPPGRIINRFSRDIEEADIFIPHQLDMVLQGIIMFVISLITMAFNFPLFLIAVVPITCYFYTINTIASVPIRNFKRLENIVRSPLIGHVTTTCNGLSTVVSCSQQSLFMQGCQQHSDMTSVGMFLFDSSMRWMSFWMDDGGSLLAIISTIIVVSTKGAVSPALAVLSLTMCINTTSLIQFFTRSINEVEGRFTSIERIHEYENLEIEKDAGDLQTDTEWPNQGMIVFSNVEMKYRIDMDPVLKNISFYVFPGQKVGIVGRTGAGKSSLATALFRLADLSRGQVLIDDIDITRIPRKWLRSKLSLIPQDPVLFAGTLRYNLDPFKKHTDEEVWKTIEQVHLKEKMKPLDLTLDLNIEENGENFSVGERQLICLARAILRQNKILVLDEATASIDTTTDALIQETVKASFSSCTVLTIAHRLNTVLHCDVILVMEAGRVIEMGNPQTLLKNPSSYFNDMIRAQTTQSHDI